MPGLIHIQKITKANRTGGVAQVVEHLSSTQDPELKKKTPVPPETKEWLIIRGWEEGQKVEKEEWICTVNAYM
jgi:hypothetical protein